MSTRPRDIPSDAVLDQRRARYGRFLQPEVQRRSRIPSLLGGDRQLRALDEERRTVLAAEARLRAEHDELLRANELAKAEHDEATREAMLTGAPPPAPLVLASWAWPEFPRAIFDELHRVISATELGVLAENAPKLSGALAEKAAPVAEALGQAEQAVRDLRDELTQIEAAQEFLADVVGPDRSSARREGAATPEERAAFIERSGSGEEATRIQRAFEESQRPPRRRWNAGPR
jgi:hypothetical protein